MADPAGGLNGRRQATATGVVLGVAMLLLTFLTGVFSLPVVTRSELVAAREISAIEFAAVRALIAQNAESVRTHRTTDDIRFRALEAWLTRIEERQQSLASWQLIVRERLGLGDGPRRDPGRAP